MQGLVLLIVAIVVITAIVGAIAQFLNKLNEASAPAPKARGGDAPRQGQKDMDRFLAEIDRLRKKNQPNAEEPSAQKPKPPEVPKKPKSPNRSRPEKLKPVRPVAEAVEPPKRKRVDSTPMDLPPLPVAPGTLSPGKVNPATLPVASVVGAIPTGASTTGAPSATVVTKLPALPGSKPQSKLDGTLAGLLASRQGMAMAVILQEVLGPPKCKK
jgi:hypothetical protein